MSAPVSTETAERAPESRSPSGSTLDSTFDRVWWRRVASHLVRPIVVGIVLLVLYLFVSNYQADSIEQRYLNSAEISAEFTQHLALFVTATVITILIAVPLGILLTRERTRWLRPVGLGLGNMGLAIPSIGLLVLLALWFSIGFWTVVWGLVAYAALPIIRNTMVGLEAVDRNIIDAARGMGMSKAAVLGRVELPLAVPVILAGIRNALVLTSATATLGTFIGAGSFGTGIVLGIKLNRPVVALTFGVLASCLALLADWFGGVCEDVLRPSGV